LHAIQYCSVGAGDDGDWTGQCDSPDATHLMRGKIAVRVLSSFLPSFLGQTLVGISLANSIYFNSIHLSCEGPLHSQRNCI
jgi:hypothetical protein